MMDEKIVFVDYDGTGWTESGLNSLIRMNHSLAENLRVLEYY